jgi:hypothetical protein
MTRAEIKIWNKAVRAAIKCLLDDEWTREYEFALRAMQRLLK